MHAPGDWFWVVIAFAVIVPMLRRRIPYGTGRWSSRWGWGGAWGPHSTGWGRPEAGDETRDRRELEERQASQETYLQQLEVRVNDLESRLDFAERLMAERRNGQLSGG